MELNGFLYMGRIFLAHQLIINPDTIVSQGLSMAIADALAHLQKLLIIIDGLFVFFDIVIEYSNWIVGSSLISDFSWPPAAKSQHFIVSKSPHRRYINSIVNLFLIEGAFIHCFIIVFLFGQEPAWSVEEKWQLDPMWHWRSHRSVAPGFIEVPNFVFLS